jgi:Galactose oxidase, central domain
MAWVLAVTLVAGGACTPGSPPKEKHAAQPLRPRAAHTATTLPDGRILIAGGCGIDSCGTADVHPTAEFYTPGQGFSAGPPMLVPRTGHSATLLADGRILMVGGFAREGTPPVATAEIYDPRTGAFTEAGKLAVPRGGNIAVRLADGRVLIAGGCLGSRTYTGSVELFDPASNTFQPGPAMPEPRCGAAAVLLADGRVLVTGGEIGREQGIASALVYLPGEQRWQAVEPMKAARYKHAVALLDDGKVLVLGGTPDDRQLLDSTEVFDPATGRFTTATAMTVPRYKFGDSLAVAGSVLVVAAGAQVDAYDLAMGTFRALTSTRKTRSFPTATTLADGSVLIVGGYDERINVHRDAVVVRP